MKQGFKRKLLAGLLSACMVFQTAGMVPVYAVENTMDSDAQKEECLCDLVVSGEGVHTNEECPFYVQSDSEQMAVEQLLTLIDALPSADEVTDENREAATADFEAVWTAYEELSADETITDLDGQLGEGRMAKLIALREVLLDMVTLVGEVYAVYEGNTFHEATAKDPTVPTGEVITDNNTITNLYITGEKSPNMYAYSNLKIVICADTVTTVPPSAFQNCTGLTSVTMPGVSKINTRTFSGCTQLTSVDMPAVTTIGIEAFKNCTELTGIASPKVTNIGTGAFSGCTKLASLTLGATPPTTVDASAFTNCPTPRTLTIQGSTAEIDTAIAAYKAIDDGNATDNLWYGWTLPTATPLQTNTVQGHSLTLNGDIGVNFYVELTDEVKVDAGAVMEMTCAGRTTTMHVKDVVAEAGQPTTITDSEGKVHSCYKFSTTVFAKQMNDTVTAVLKDGEGKELLTDTYSVATYAKEAEKESNQSLKNLTSAMVGYGAYAQTLFNYNTDNLAGALPDVTGVTAELLSSHAFTKSGEAGGLSYYGAKLTLEEKTKIKLYFQVNSGSIGDYTISVDGTAATPVKSEYTNVYYIVIPDIAAQDLDKVHTIVAGNVTISNYSALSYVNSALNNLNDRPVNTATAKALYLYWQAAKAYYK